MGIFKFIIVGAVVVVVSSCGNDEPVKEVNKEEVAINIRESFITQIKKYEADMHKSQELNPAVASSAIQIYGEFAKNFPQDSLTPDFLFKTAEIQTAMQQYPQSLATYQKITTGYPNYKLFPESLYLQGYLLDNFLNDDAKAKTIYEEVIAKYPNLPYANDAKAAINNLGKTDEELIKEFEKKNKK